MTQPPYQPPAMPGQPPESYMLGHVVPARKKRKMWPWIAGGLAGVVLLCCGIGVAANLAADEDKKPAANSSPSTAPATEEPIGPLDSPAAVAQAIEKRSGLKCDNLSAVENPIGATARSNCRAAGGEIVISTYASQQDANAHMANYAGLLGGISDVRMATGDKWTVSGDDDAYVRKAAEVLHGTYSVIPKAASSPPPKPKPKTYKALTAREWKLIAKNPDAYKGKTYVVYGVVTQFDSATGDDTFRADIGHKNMAEAYDYETNTLLTGTADQLKNIVEDDEFRANVTVMGSFSYDTQLGGNTTVPLLQIDLIKVL